VIGWIRGIFRRPNGPAAAVQPRARRECQLRHDEIESMAVKFADAWRDERIVDAKGVRVFLRDRGVVIERDEATGEVSWKYRQGWMPNRADA